MDFGKISCLICLVSVLLVVFSIPSAVTAGDIVHHDDLAPKKPGCENDFVLVKIQTWVDGVEDAEFVGVGARFGTTIVSKEKNAHQTLLTRSNPRDCCSTPKNKLAGDVIMVDRGNCKFTAKANYAEAAGASAMVCDPDETDLDIKIPAVMLPQDAGATLEKMLSSNSSACMNLGLCRYLGSHLAENNQNALLRMQEDFEFTVQLYSPKRPVVDIAEVFLWLMAVGTVLCASYWSAWSAREAAIEHDKLLKVILLFLNLRSKSLGISYI
nr:signal peptide peptidase-like 2 isoform X2 [Ipomoea batatas]